MHRTLRFGNRIASCAWPCILVLPLLLLGARPTLAQEEPYFVVDNHHLQEPGTLEIGHYSVTGDPKNGNRYVGSELQLEYRLQHWWASELDFDYQTTFNDSTLFTGYAWANRFKILPSNHRLNPVIYLAWEDENGADKSISEIEGHSGESSLTVPNALAERIHEHEIESKLILSHDRNGWDFVGNILADKDLNGPPWEFGYALAISRPLSTRDSEEPCNFCRRKLTPGLELYGGLGDRHSFGLRDTEQYVAPEISWALRGGIALKSSVNLGLNSQSQHVFFHFAVTYAVPGFGHRMRKWFRP
jgi:hypothetical protein